MIIRERRCSCSHERCFLNRLFEIDFGRPRGGMRSAHLRRSRPSEIRNSRKTQLRLGVVDVRWTNTKVPRLRRMIAAKHGFRVGDPCAKSVSAQGSISLSTDKMQEYVPVDHV